MAGRLQSFIREIIFYGVVCWSAQPQHYKDKLEVIKAHVKGQAGAPPIDARVVIPATKLQSGKKDVC